MKVLCLIVETSNGLDGQYCDEHIDSVERFIPDEDGINRGKVRCRVPKCSAEGTVYVEDNWYTLEGKYCNKHVEDIRSKVTV